MPGTLLGPQPTPIGPTRDAPHERPKIVGVAAGRFVLGNGKRKVKSTCGSVVIDLHLVLRLGCTTKADCMPTSCGQTMTKRIAGRYPCRHRSDFATSRVANLPPVSLVGRHRRHAQWPFLVAVRQRCRASDSQSSLKCPDGLSDPPAPSMSGCTRRRPQERSAADCRRSGTIPRTG